MPEVDLSVFQRQTPLLQQQQLQQAFLAKQALDSQALQTGAIDAATKQNALTYQLIGAGAANGAEGLQAAKAKLGQLGIDASTYSDDPTIAAKQALAAQQASSPYGTLFNAQQKVIGNDIAAAGAFGSTNNPYNQALPGVQLTPTASGALQPTITPTNQGSVTISNKVAPIDGSDPTVNISSTQTAGAPIQTPVPSAKGLAQIGASIPQFSAPTQNPGETRQAYDTRVDNARKDFELNNKGALKEQETSGGKSGENAAELSKSLNAVIQNLPVALQRFGDLKTVAPLTSSGLNAQANEEGSGINQQLANVISPTTSTANALFLQKTNQGVLPELGPVLTSTGVRGNKFLEGIISSASGLNPALPTDAKIAAINGLQDQYIANAKSLARQARALGQSAPSDEEIDAMAKQAITNFKPSDDIKNITGGKAALQASFNAKKSGTPLITTQADYDALPSGTTYTEADGNTYKKP